ncbi:hypothetical protein BpHYR1_011811 [Brachionus plicatilis]|uniref:Uncharacterized protein n=1 Tax=Brachionus plicatilis TaxID=10195 RepID=A0A3M7S1G3_BRAPC|nr:hypothetical protein BpHYR1_011811 [Brachionus plicatilis]
MIIRGPMSLSTDGNKASVFECNQGAKYLDNFQSDSSHCSNIDWNSFDSSSWSWSAFRPVTNCPCNSSVNSKFSNCPTKSSSSKSSSKLSDLDRPPTRTTPLGELIFTFGRSMNRNCLQQSTNRVAPIFLSSRANLFVKANLTASYWDLSRRICSADGQLAGFDI